MDDGGQAVDGSNIISGEVVESGKCSKASWHKVAKKNVGA